jgi:hypothetical protein
MAEEFGSDSSVMGPAQHGTPAAHLYFLDGIVAAQPVVAPVHDGVAAQRNLAVLPLDPFPQADLGDQSAGGVLHQDMHGVGSLLWDMIDGLGSDQGQDQAGTAEAPGTVEAQTTQVRH